MNKSLLLLFNHTVVTLPVDPRMNKSLNDDSAEALRA